MNKGQAIIAVYEIANLEQPNDEVLSMMLDLDFERVLELMLVMRKAGKVRSPVNFIRRAIQEGWTVETERKNVNRKVQRITEEKYISKGYSTDEARKKALEIATDY